MDLQQSEERTQFANLPEGPLKADSAELLGNLSRELRTPLNSILGFASLLQDQELSEADRNQFLHRIIANGDYLLQLLDDASNFSRVVKGELQVEAVPFNISDMVYDVAQSLKAAAEKKDLEIDITFRNPIPKAIQSDPLKIRQILTNVLGNTIRFANGNGFILVSLCYEQDPILGGRVIIDIDDSGSRIVKDAVITEAQKLDQLEASFNRQLETVRPGLALSEKFAEALGGRITVKKSEIGEGQSFILAFPVGDVRQVPFIHKKTSPSFAEKIISSFKKTNRLEGVRVLLAEDSEDNATVIRLYLAKEGVKLTYVRNGLEAVDAAKSEEFDLILMDIQMPLMDGLEAIRQIRQAGFSKPIIALTGQFLRDDAEKSLKAGADAHLTKPILKEPLVEEIQARISK